MYLKEIARRANVSTATVSKVLRGADDVAEETRNRVLMAVQTLENDNLDFERKATTLKEVAQRASVSVSTASKALKGSYDVAEETRNRVLAVAKEVGYFKEKKRVTLENHHPDGWCIAILTPEISSPFYNTVAQMLTTAAKECGCRVMLFETGFDEETVDAVAHECVINPRINAIISFCHIKEALATNATPIITTHPSHRFTQIDIALDNALAAIREQYPRDTSVAVVSELLTASRQRDVKLHFPQAITLSTNKRYDEAGVQAADKLLAMPSLPQLVFCAYDEIAYGLIDRLNANGVRVPEDVEVIGINDSYSSQWVHGGLSTIAFDYGDVFCQVIRDIVHDLQHLGFYMRHYRVNSRFVPRRTTK